MFYYMHITKGVYMDKLQISKENGKIVAPQTITEDLYTRFISFIDAKPKTIGTYTRALKQFFRYIDSTGKVMPCREDIIAFRDELIASGHKPSTIQNYITTVRLFLLIALYFYNPLVRLQFEHKCRRL